MYPVPSYIGLFYTLQQRNQEAFFLGRTTFSFALWPSFQSALAAAQKITMFCVGSILCYKSQVHNQASVFRIKGRGSCGVSGGGGGVGHVVLLGHGGEDRLKFGGEYRGSLTSEMRSN
jgi:hypothetical protein